MVLHLLLYIGWWRFLSSDFPFATYVSSLKSQESPLSHFLCLHASRGGLLPLTKSLPWPFFNLQYLCVLFSLFFHLADTFLRSPLVQPPSHGYRSTHNSPIHTASGSRLTQNFSVSVPTLIYTGTRSGGRQDAGSVGRYFWIHMGCPNSLPLTFSSTLLGIMFISLFLMLGPLTADIPVFVDAEGLDPIFGILLVRYLH